VHRVALAGDERQLRGLLEALPQRVLRDRRHERAERIAAGVEKRAAEEVGIAERQAQRDARTPREAADVQARGIDRVALEDVVGREQRQRLAPRDDVRLVPRVRSAHIDDAGAVQHLRPPGRQARLFPGRHEHQQAIAVRRGLRWHVQHELLGAEIDRLLDELFVRLRKRRLHLCGGERTEHAAHQLRVGGQRGVLAEHHVFAQPRRLIRRRARGADGGKEQQAELRERR
jgi:hypothetical protein